jgi:hypothetical protein
VVVEEIMRKGNFRFGVSAIGLAVMLAIAAGPLAEYAAAQTPSVGSAGQSVGNTGQSQIPQPPDNSVNWPGAGYGAGALLCNVLYIPAKLTYAILGGIVGGGTYLVTAGNQQAANTVWRSSLGGDYVVTPQMLAGQQSINFSGPTATPPPAGAEPSQSSSSSMTTTTASSGGVAPITPLPPSGSSANASSPAGGQPLDHGAGPAPGAPSSANIE